MNIVVTGSAGFFGSYVTNYLIEQGHKVIGLDNLSRRGSELNAKTQRNNLFMEFHECDVSDKIALDSLGSEFEEFFKTDSEVMKFNYQIDKSIDSVKSVSLKKSDDIEGKLIGIKGQYLIFEDSSVFNVRSNEGYVVDISIFD